MAIIKKNPHQQALSTIQQELQQRVQQRDWINRRIEELNTAIQHLTPLAQGYADIGSEMSLPQLCLRVLSFTPGFGVSVPKIKEGLAAMGIEVSATNPLAVLHTAMGRLVQNGYVIPHQGQGTTHFEITPAGQSYVQQVL